MPSPNNRVSDEDHKRIIETDEKGEDFLANV